MLVFMVATSMFSAPSIAIAEEAVAGPKTDAFPVTIVVEW